MGWPYVSVSLERAGQRVSRRGSKKKSIYFVYMCWNCASKWTFAHLDERVCATTLWSQEDRNIIRVKQQIFKGVS